MGVRLGWALPLVILLAIEVPIVSLIDANNTLCLNDCSQQSNNHDFKCKVFQDQGCNLLGKISSSQVTPVARPLVYITGISVASHPDSSLYTLTLSWKSPSTEAWNITRGFGVRWNSYHSQSSQPPESKCQLYDVLRVSHKAKITDVPIFHWCGRSVGEVHKHLVIITALPSNNSLNFIITLPSNISLTTDANSGPEWTTPVGVAVDTRWRSVAVVIQGAPPGLNITSYKLQLLNADNDSVKTVHVLQANETSFVFENQTWHNGNVGYIIQVTPLGPGCQPLCQTSKSATFKVPGNPITTTLPSTPSSSLVPTRVSTSSTVLPPSKDTSTASLRTTRATGRGSHPSQSPDPSVIMQPATDKSEQSKKIIAGTVCGAVGLAIVVGIIFCVYRRSRNVHTGSFPMQRFGDRRDSDMSVIMDPTKNMPIVLLLYSYDCPAHEVVVTTFAYYLKEVCNCEVILDIWDQHNLQEQGSYSWLSDKVDVAEFIVMVSSTGARFKCARNRQIRMKHDRTLPDVFAWGVDHVAEKIRTATTDADVKSRYITVYFDYAGKSDIPPKLEITKKFCLMKDIYSLYCHLHRLKEDSGHPPKCGLTYETLTKTEEGRQVKDSLIDAKHFFRDNPNWLGQTLEPVTPVLTSSGRDTNPDAAPIHSRKHPTSPSSGGPDKDSFLEERKKKRIREMEGTMQRIPLTKPGKEELVAPSYSTPGTSPTHVTSEGSSSVTSMSPLMAPTPRLAPNQGSNLTYANSNGTSQSRELESEEDTDVDDSEMQRDIDFIQNFDAHTWDTQNGSSGHFFVDVDMGVYTPPEHFISLASLEEEATRALSLSNPASPAHRVNGCRRSPVTHASPHKSSQSSLTNSPIKGSQSVSGNPVKAASPAHFQNSPQVVASPDQSGSPMKTNSPVMYTSPVRQNSVPVSAGSSQTGSPLKRVSPEHDQSAASSSPTQLPSPPLPSSPLILDSPLSPASPISLASPARLSPSSPSSPFAGSPKGSPAQAAGYPVTNQSVAANGHFVMDFSDHENCEKTVSL